MRYEEWRAGGEHIRVAGKQAFVRVSGAGQALLFFHGFPTSSYDWSECIGILEKNFRCVVFDFWGFGDSDPLEPYDYDRQVELALAVAAHARLERPVLVAHDYGVSVAQELLARGPASLAIAGVVYLNGGIEPVLHRPIAIQRLLAGPLGAVLGPLLIHKATFARSMARILEVRQRFDTNEHWKAVSARGSHRRAHALLHYIAERRRRRERWVEAFANPDTPVALAWGELDPVSGSHVLAWAKQQRPDASVLSLAVGHYPQIEAASEVASFIARFAERISR